MTSHRSSLPPSDLDRSIDRRVRRALSAAPALEPTLVAESILARIDGRAPGAVADAVTASRFRTGAAVAAGVLMTLSWLEPETTVEPKPAGPDDVSVLALSDPDADREARRTRPSDVMIEIFDLETEVPQ